MLINSILSQIQVTITSGEPSETICSIYTLRAIPSYCNVDIKKTFFTV